MTPAELAQARRRLVAFAAEMFQPLARADQRRWGECYLRGLMLDGKRKSIQPMAGGCRTVTSRRCSSSSARAPGTGGRSASGWRSR